MSGLRRSWSRRTAQIAAASLLAASGMSFFASTAFAAAGGNNGTVLINGQNFSNGNDPHITCPITFKWSGFDPGVADDYTITFTGTNPTGGTVDAGGVAPLSSNQTGGSFLGPDHTASPPITITGGKPNNKGEYHVTIVVETKSAANTDTKSKTVWLGGCNPAAPSGGQISFSGQCTTVGDVNSGYTWDITANAVAGAPAASFPATWSDGGANSGGFTIVDGTTFSTPKGVNSITVTPNAALPANWTLSQPKAATPNPCGVNNLPPPPPPPGGGQVTVNGQCDTTTQGYDWTVTASPKAAGVDGTWTPAGGSATNWTTDASGAATFSSGVGQNVIDFAVTTANWTGPATASTAACVPQTAADPQVTEANHCVSGMNLTLSNMNGTADETFTVVEPDGTTEQVLVRAGQLKKLVFAIEEDTTGTLSVTAPGLAKQSFAYHKNCATVLGIKQTRKPPTVVKGENAQLPFTGFDTKRALLDGSVVFFLGAVLCILGARRKEEEPLYY